MRIQNDWQSSILSMDCSSINVLPLVSPVPLLFFNDYSNRSLWDWMDTPTTLMTSWSQASQMKSTFTLLNNIFNAWTSTDFDIISPIAKFFKPEVEYLGHKISASGIEPSETGVVDIKHLPR